MHVKDRKSMEVSPYLRRPLRSLEEVLAARAAREHQSLLEVGHSKKSNGTALPNPTASRQARN